MVCKCWWQTKVFFFFFFFFVVVFMQAMMHWICWEMTSESVVLMMQAAEENRMLSVFQWSSVSRRLRQAACLSRVSTCDSRPPVWDASGRWGLCLYRFVCTPSKLAVVLHPPPPPSPARNSSSSSTLPVQTPTITLARYISWSAYGWKPTLNPCFFLWVFCHMSVSGCPCPGIVNKPLLPCGV